jgi:hypothetical protein
VFFGDNIIYGEKPKVMRKKMRMLILGEFAEKNEDGKKESQKFGIWVKKTSNWCQ